jgi:hypothetical protein
MEERAKQISMAVEPKHIPKKILASDERVVFESHPGWWASMKAATLAVLVLLAVNMFFDWRWIPSAPDLPYASSLLSGASGGVQGLFALLALIALLISVWVLYVRAMRRRKTVFAITDERIIKQTGLVIKKQEDIPLTQIENIDVRQSLGTRILGYGTLVFSTQGLGGYKDDRSKQDMVWEAVPRPTKVRTILQEVMDIRDKPVRYTEKELRQSAK